MVNNSGGKVYIWIKTLTKNEFINYSPPSTTGGEVSWTTGNDGVQFARFELPNESWGHIPGYPIAHGRTIKVLGGDNLNYDILIR